MQGAATALLLTRPVRAPPKELRSELQSWATACCRTALRQAPHTERSLAVLYIVSPSKVTAKLKAKFSRSPSTVDLSQPCSGLWIKSDPISRPEQILNHHWQHLLPFRRSPQCLKSQWHRCHWWGKGKKSEETVCIWSRHSAPSLLIMQKIKKSQSILASGKFGG